MERFLDFAGSILGSAAGVSAYFMLTDTRPSWALVWITLGLSLACAVGATHMSGRGKP